MMRAILISIRPEWCKKILNSEKTVEIRKNRPKIETPFKCYIYCTLSPKNVLMFSGGQIHLFEWHNFKKTTPCLMIPANGKVIGEFVCDNITIHLPDDLIVKEDAEKALSGSCVGRAQILAYLMGKKKKARYCDLPDFYGWHISDLVLYDKPKELREFTGLKQTRFGGMPYKIQRPPQSWCYVEVLD